MPEFANATEIRARVATDLKAHQYLTRHPFSVIARSPCDEAIQGLRDAAPKPAGAVRRPLDCIALLAMTGQVQITPRLRASVSFKGTGRRPVRNPHSSSAW